MFSQGGVAYPTLAHDSLLSPSAPLRPPTTASVRAMSKKEDEPVEEPQVEDDDAEESDEYDVEVTDPRIADSHLDCSQGPACLSRIS